MKVGYDGVYILWTCFPDDIDNSHVTHFKIMVAFINIRVISSGPIGSNQNQTNPNM